MGQNRNPHPGVILRHEFLDEIRMSQNALAQAIGVPGNRIHAIVNGTRSVTAETDLRLCRYLGPVGGLFPAPAERLRHTGGQAANRR